MTAAIKGTGLTAATLAGKKLYSGLQAENGQCSGLRLRYRSNVRLGANFRFPPAGQLFARNLWVQSGYLFGHESGCAIG